MKLSDSLSDGYWVFPAWPLPHQVLISLCHAGEGQSANLGAVTASASRSVQ